MRLAGIDCNDGSLTSLDCDDGDIEWCIHPASNWNSHSNSNVGDTYPCSEHMASTHLKRSPMTSVVLSLIICASLKVSEIYLSRNCAVDAAIVNSVWFTNAPFSNSVFAVCESWKFTPRDWCDYRKRYFMPVEERNNGECSWSGSSPVQI